MEHLCIILQNMAFSVSITGVLMCVCNETVHDLTTLTVRCNIAFKAFLKCDFILPDSPFLNFDTLVLIV